MSEQELEQLKELVRQNIKLSQDTNRLIHQMRRASRLKSLFWFLIFCASVGSSAYAYFYILAPRLEQARTVYTKNIDTAESLWNKATNFLNFFDASTTQTH